MLAMTGKRAVSGLLTLMVVVMALYSLVTKFAAPGTTTAAPATGSWPAMTLVYQIQGKHRGLNAPMDTQIWKLSYQNERQWRKELVSSSADPREIGTVYSFEGTTYTVYSAVVKQLVHTSQYPDAPMTPERWFARGRDRVLESKGYTKIADVGGQSVRYVKTDTVPCERDNPGVGKQLTGTTEPAKCATAPAYQITETIVYRVDLAVPIEIINQIDGEIVQHIIVTQLTTP